MAMVTDHLERHVEKRGERLLLYDRDGRNLRPADFQAAWHAARGTAGRDDLKFHHLRHTGAVLAAQSNATLADLMGRLGHTTQDPTSGLADDSAFGLWPCIRSGGQRLDISESLWELHEV